VPDIERYESLVLGNGTSGKYLAWMMAKAGQQTAIIERKYLGGSCPKLETDIRQVEGRSGHKVKLRVHSKKTGAERVVEGADLLVATGRKANTDGIVLEQTGVELHRHGYIKVNERLQTTAPDIWAMGDCAGSLMFTHVAVDDFRVVYDNLNGGNRTTRNRLIPFCLFTDPKLVRVGLNESEARRDGIEYRLAKMPLAEVLRTATVSEPRGILKILIGKNSDEILGFTTFGFEASELLAAVQTAMIGHLPYTLLRDAIFTHPTVAEGLNELLGRVERPEV
jgi:pyruvate/2-oxoglutarate dehydrogenase complex dihydrolipoamide dehydrogenase (E3) component